MSPITQAAPQPPARAPAADADAVTVARLTDRLTSAALGLVWALWTGGVIALFLFVTAMFYAAFPDDRANAARAAQAAFLRFGRYQLALAAIAVLLSIAWMSQRRPRSRARTALLVLTLLTTALAAATYLITLKVIDLSHQGQTNTTFFKQLHGWSMTVFMAEALLLLVCGAVLHWELTRRPSR